MGLRFRDLVVDVVQRMAPAPPGPCGCTASAHEPQCGAKGSQNQNPRPNCPKPSAVKPPKKRLDDLGLLREQLRAELNG